MNRNGRLNAYAKSRVRSMSAVEAAWVGAMIEAEGCVAWKMNPIRRQTISLNNTDIEIISALLRAVGAGAVWRSFSHDLSGFPSTKPLYIWHVGRRREVEDIARQCAPYCMKLQKVAVP